MLTLSNIYNKINLVSVWLVLMLLTLINTLFAESPEPSMLMVELVCITMVCKGILVADHFMGLRHAAKSVRATIVSYILVMSLLIAVAILYPDFIAQLTTIN